MTSSYEVALVGVVMGTVATIISALTASLLYARSGCRSGENCCELQFRKRARDTPSEVAAASNSAVILV